MKVIFWGSPDFAVPILKALCEKHQVLTVISQPDSKSGRGRKLQPPPVAQYALEQNIPVLQPKTPNTKSFRESLEALNADVFVVAAYGKILSSKLLAAAPRGCINVHFSLLPKHRGASPLTAAILSGDQTTGISIMKMTVKMDEGPVYKMEEIPLGAEDTTGTLQQRLGALAPKPLLEVLEEFPQPVEQDHKQATYCKILAKRDGRIPWEKPASYIDRFVRAMSPWPTAHTKLKGHHIIIKKVEICEQQGKPASIIAAKEELIVATGEKSIKILQLQKAGKREMSAQEFMRGNKVQLEDFFE